MKRALVVALALVALVALAACGEKDEAVAPSGAEEQADGGSGGGATAGGSGGGDAGQSGGGSGAGQAGIEIATGESDYGEILFDADDRTIYLFDAEESERPECYDDCATAWPPVLTEGEPQADTGVDAKLLGTTERDDGTTQVTYNGHPLYYYHDEPPGQVLCHNVDEFGGLWLVVDPSGEAVQ